MKVLVFILHIMFIISCTNKDKIVDKDKLLGNDYRLFQETPVWELVKAVWDDDISQIKRLVEEKKLDINYQESKFGKTLLMLTVVNEQYESCKTLLELGANPDLHDKYDGSSAIIDAAKVNNIGGDNTKFIKLLLKYGANPNDVEAGEIRDGDNLKNTPLLAAVSLPNEINSPIGKVKVLTEAGANINYKTGEYMTPLKMAYVQNHLDVVLYFLEKGADYNTPLFNRNGKEYYLWDDLRELLLPLDSEKYQIKMEIVNFLKQKGIDYRKIPVPDYIVQEVKKTYPDDWKEYLSKY